MDFELESYDINVLNISLKPYQVQIIDDLLKNSTVEEAIEKFLTANGPTDTIQFGGIGDKKDKHPFIESFKNEFDKFICGDPEYENYYPKVKEGTGIPMQAIISGISAAIGAKMGINAAMISPVIVLSLSLLGTMGRKAYCKMKGFPVKVGPEEES